MEFFQNRCRTTAVNSILIFYIIDLPLFIVQISCGQDLD